MGEIYQEYWYESQGMSDHTECKEQEYTDHWASGIYRNLTWRICAPLHRLRRLMRDWKPLLLWPIGYLLHFFPHGGGLTKPQGYWIYSQWNYQSYWIFGHHILEKLYQECRRSIFLYRESICMKIWLWGCNRNLYYWTHISMWHGVVDCSTDKGEK